MLYNASFRGAPVLHLLNSQTDMAALTKTREVS